MRWRSVRSRASTAAAVVTVPVLVLVLALLDQGFPLARLDLNDGGVWLTATSKLQLGRWNAQVEELNGGLSAAGSRFDVLQDESDVLLVEQGSIAVVDPASVTLTTQVAVPGADVTMAAGVVAVVDPDGNLWVRPISALDTLRIATDAPDVELGKGGAAVVARSGAVLAVAPEDGAVTRVDLVDGAARSTPLGTLGAGPVDRLTAVGDTAVVLSDRTVRTLDGEVALEGDDLALQQPGPEASRVLVASRTALLEVPLDGGSAVEHPTDGSGVPAEPVQVGRCAHGAWASPVGSYVQLCDGEDAEVRNLEEMSTADVLAFRVNRQVVVLNDTLRGRLWMPLQDTDLRVPDWTQIEPEEQPDEAQEETEASDTTQDLVTECSAESAPPTAADDEFGVRPGRTTILPVIDNDSSSDCGILVISEFDPLPAEFGRIEAIYGGRSLQVAVAEGATGTAELTYTITDGRGTNAPSTARVVLTARDGSLDSPPVQLRTGSLEVEQGGQADHQALADFLDPDGDDLVLVGATTDPTVRIRAVPAGRVGDVPGGRRPAGPHERDPPRVGRDVHDRGSPRRRRAPRGLAGAADRPGARRDLRRPARDAPPARRRAQLVGRAAPPRGCRGGRRRHDHDRPPGWHLHVQRGARRQLLRAVPRLGAAAAGDRSGADRRARLARDGPAADRGPGPGVPPGGRRGDARPPGQRHRPRRARCWSCSRSTRPRGCGSPSWSTTWCRSRRNGR